MDIYTKRRLSRKAKLGYLSFTMLVMLAVLGGMILLFPQNRSEVAAQYILLVSSIVLVFSFAYVLRRILVNSEDEEDRQENELDDIPEDDDR